MSKAFDLKKQLKLLDKSLLCRLFTEFGILADVPWETLKPHDVGPVIEGWGAIDDDTRRQLEVVLQDVNEVKTRHSHATERHNGSKMHFHEVPQTPFPRRKRAIFMPRYATDGHMGRKC